MVLLLINGSVILADGFKFTSSVKSLEHLIKGSVILTDGSYFTISVKSQRWLGFTFSLSCASFDSNVQHYKRRAFVVDIA